MLLGHLVISVPPEGGSRSQLRVRTAPCPSGSASETNNECQIKFELLHVNPEAYLTDVLTKLVNNWPNSRLAELTPWAWAAQHR